MAVTTIDYLYDLARELLSSAEDILTDDGITLPDRRAIYPGPIVDDTGEGCDGLLAVSLQRIFSGVPGNEIAEPERCGWARSAEYVLRILRCLHPNEGDQSIIPTVSEVEGDAQTLYRDAWSLHQGIIARHASGILFETKCQNVLIGPMNAVENSDLGGFEIVVTVQIAGT